MSKQIESTLYIHDDEVNSVFELVGNNENDLSYSLGYTLTKSLLLLKYFIKKIYKNINFSEAVIKLQQAGEDKGYTDFEITIDNKYLFIIEAKKGWILPEIKQLKRYISRFRGFEKTKRNLIVLSDCKKEYFKKSYVASLYGIPVKSLTWEDVINLLNEVYSRVPNKEKVILRQFKEYLEEVVIMDNQESNKVYVVSLSNDIPSWSELSWKDIVCKKMHYFFPQEKNWPKIPPNYIAFRSGGKLLSIHHVEKYEVVRDVHQYIPEIKKNEVKNMFLLWLGRGFEPRKELPNGKIWSNGRVWCMLDTLFTSKTIKEACDISKKRLKNK